GLEGAQILARNLEWAGTLQAVRVDSAGARAPRPAEIVTFPRPFGKLATTVSGSWLLDWETPLAECKDPVLDRPVKAVVPAPSTYYRSQSGVEDYLEALADETGTPVVCDAFRVPIVGNKPAEGEDVRSWLSSFQETQKCFVKVQDGRISVRHGGFWDLRDWEPPEDLVRQMEAAPALGLDDYATFAFSVGMLNRNLGYLGDQLPIFDSEQIPLFRFDPTPLRNNYVILAAYGEFTEEQRVHILLGGFVNLFHNDYDFGWTNHQVVMLPGPHGKKVPVEITTGQGSYYKGSDFFVNLSAVLGPFYGARPLNFEIKLLESATDPSFYRLQWGDSPDQNMDYVSNYDLIFHYHAHYFRVRMHPAFEQPIVIDQPRCLRGRFIFFSSVNDVDGVETEVTIP
ncbi:MAG: hypothetical protein P4L46_18840, partial [Fimbriimonas sp.]|nr:hypothetical protein [Fimbriimonas sp.]